MPASLLDMEKGMISDYDHQVLKLTSLFYEQYDKRMIYKYN